MTDITDSEQWAASEGKAASQAGFAKAQQIGADVDRTQVDAIVYAAWLAAGRDRET